MHACSPLVMFLTCLLAQANCRVLPPRLGSSRLKVHRPCLLSACSTAFTGIGADGGKTWDPLKHQLFGYYALGRPAFYRHVLGFGLTPLPRFGRGLSQRRLCCRGQPAHPNLGCGQVHLVEGCLYNRPGLKFDLQQSFLVKPHHSSHRDLSLFPLEGLGHRPLYFFAFFFFFALSPFSSAASKAIQSNWRVPTSDPQAPYRGLRPPRPAALVASCP